MRFLICLLLILSLCGCAQVTDTPDLMPRYPCTYSLAGSMGNVPCAFSVKMEASERGTITFTAPAELAGVQFIVHSLPNNLPESDTLQYAERGVTVRFGEMEIPLSEGAYPATIFGVVKAFSTTKEQLSEIKKQGDNSVLTYTDPSGYISFTVLGDGTPSHLYIDLYGAICDLTIETVTYEENTL